MMNELFDKEYIYKEYIFPTLVVSVFAFSFSFIHSLNFLNDNLNETNNNNDRVGSFFNSFLLQTIITG